MLIKKEDFKYLETLCQGLDVETKKRFLKLLAQAASVKAGENLIGKIKVVSDEIIGERGTEPSEWVTRTMIKKACKEVKQ